MKDNFFIVGSTGHSLINFRYDLIKYLKKKFKITSLSQNYDYVTYRKLKKINVNYKSYGSNKSFIVNEFLSFVNIIKIFKNKKEIQTKILSYTLRANIYVGFISLFNSKILHYPMITGLGGIYLSKDENFINFLRYFFFFNLLKISLLKAKVIIFQNKYDQKLFKDKNIIKSKSAVIPGSGVKIENFNVTKFPKKITFLMISRIIKYKGIENFISVAKQVKKINKNIRFFFIGKTQKSFSLNKNYLKNNVNSSEIKILNWGKKVNKYYSNCSVYVLPSKREGASRTILEAMASGRPIIASNVPGCKQLVKNGYNGYLVEYNNNFSLFSAINKFLNEPNLIKKFGLNSRKHVKKYYDVNLVNKKIFEIINK